MNSRYYYKRYILNGLLLQYNSQRRSRLPTASGGGEITRLPGKSNRIIAAQVVLLLRLPHAPQMRYCDRHTPDPIFDR